MFILELTCLPWLPWRHWPVEYVQASRLNCSVMSVRPNAWNDWLQGRLCGSHARQLNRSGDGPLPAAPC